MNLFSSTDTYLGLFETHSLIMSFNCEFDEHSGVIKKVSTPNGKSFSEKWETLSEKDMTVLTADVHEHDHFIQFISTPFGILLWRCYQVLIRDTMTAVAWLDRLGINREISDRSLLEWWENDG